MALIDTKNLPSQNTIMANWPKEQPKVSIICTTFNHQDYLEKALMSFLCQKTHFQYEIIIHDDASTDNTQSIIQRYCQKYPKIINPIFQSENQYSKGNFKPIVYAAKFAKGSYLALCEGDDFWYDNSKLQQQYDALSKNPEIKLCTHSSFKLENEELTLINNDIKNTFDIIDTTEFIIGDGGFVSTCSLFLKKNVLDELPDWFIKKAPVGDYYIQIYASYPSGAIYINKPMSIYRADTINNWTSKNSHLSEKIITHRKRLLVANHLCEKSLAKKKLFPAFTISNFKHAKIAVSTAYQQGKFLDSFKLTIKLFELRFFLTPIFYIKRKWSQSLMK